MFLKRVVAIAVIGFIVSANSVAKAGNLVTNGGFEGSNDSVQFPFGNPFYHSKERFSEIKPFGWSGGDKITYLSFPKFATVTDNNGTLSVWTSPGDTSPAGGNFVMGDGDPAYSDAIYQTINNLTIGAIYAVSFYQAAGQNIDKSGDTWEQWKVGFGDQWQLSDLMNTPSHGIHPWETQTLYFTADSISAKLSFLAYGGPGSGPIGGLPPVSFLDGVSVNAFPVGPNVVPEPSSLALSALGLLGLVALHLRRRRSANSSTVFPSSKVLQIIHSTHSEIRTITSRNAFRTFSLTVGPVATN